MDAAEAPEGQPEKEPYVRYHLIARRNRPSLQEVVATNLSARRRQLKLTPEQLSEIAGIDLELLARIERGVAGPLPCEKLISLAAAVGWQPNKLLAH